MRNRTSVAALGTAARTGAKNGRTIVQIHLGVKDSAAASQASATIADGTDPDGVDVQTAVKGRCAVPFRPKQAQPATSRSSRLD